MLRISTTVEPDVLERVEVQMKRKGVGDRASYIRQAMMEKLHRDESADPGRKAD